jgi:hypothetical protein
MPRTEMVPHRVLGYVGACAVLTVGFVSGCSDDGPSAPSVTDGSGVPTTIEGGPAQNLEPGTNLSTPATNDATPGATGMIPGETSDLLGDDSGG